MPCQCNLLITGEEGHRVYCKSVLSLKFCKSKTVLKLKVYLKNYLTTIRIHMAF